MRRYDSYKDSGVEWIGEIPSGWEVVKLKRLTKVKRGSSPRPIDDPKYFDDFGEFKWVRISDVTNSERYLFETSETLSELGSSLSTKIYPNDLFLSIAGSVGKPIIPKVKCCIHDGFVWFDGLKYNSEFLYYTFLLGTCFSGLGKWGTQLNLNTDTVGDIFIPLIDLELQQQIVSYLDTKTSLIDSLIEKTQRKIELLKENRTSLINEVVTKGLNPNVEMKDSGVEWIGEIPSHWTKSKLKFVSEIVTGNTPPTKDEDNYEGGEFLWVKPNEINGFNPTNDTNQKLTEKGKSLSRVLPPFSVLVNGIGRIGEFGYSEKSVSTNQQINSIVYNHKVDKRYGLFHTSMMKEGFISNSEKVVVPILNKTKHENIEFIIPPLSEQQQIVSYLDEHTQLIDKTISLEERRIELLKEYRQSLISEVVTGKRKVVN
jgi:type I restriction enzyme S subunit